MMRTITVAIMLTALTLVATTVGAQSPEPVPTATADEVVFFGEVPAPPGTTVWVRYLLTDPVEIVTCASATTTASSSGDPDQSSFVLVIQVSCFASTVTPASICWGEHLCSLVLNVVNGMPTLHAGGETADLGLLVRTGLTPEELAEGPLIIPHGDGANAQPDGGGGDAEIALPDTGAGAGQGRAKIGWLLWAGVTLLAAGVAFGGMSLAVRRKS